MTDAEKKVLDEEVVVESVDVEVGTMEDVDAIMKKFDRESNTRVWEGTPKKILRYVLAAFMLFMVYMNLWATWSGQIRRCLFVGFVILFTFFIYPVKKGNVKPNSMPWYDILLAVAGCIPYFYYVANFKRIVAMGIAIGQTEVILGIIGTLVLAECCRRAVGLPILIVAGCFVLYAFIGRGMSLDLVVYNIFYTTNGIIGTPISVCSTYIALFLLFGAFLEASGCSDFINDIAISLTGKIKSGPALSAVVASGLMGSINGSAVANVVGTGTFTIPLMKSRGYKPQFAGGVEAVASTGGQILPPVMGSGAFLMVAFTEQKYIAIVIAAVIPALLYYWGCAVAVMSQTEIAHVTLMDPKDIPKSREVMKDGWIYLLIIAVLLYCLLVAQYSPLYSALWATCAVPVVMLFDKKKRFTLKTIPSAMVKSGFSAMSIVIGCACAGIVVGMVSITGIGVIFGDMMIQAAHGLLFPSLLFTAITCIVLGMGLPTTAAYVIAASILAPSLIKLGLAPLTAHLFVFYFACLSAITPPVALAAYAGAGIAKTNPMTTAVEACKLGFAGFMVPFAFCYNPAMMMQGSVGEIISVAISAIIGVAIMSAGFQGWLLWKLNWLERIVFIAGGLLMFIPGTLTDITGLVIAAALLLVNVKKWEKGPKFIMDKHKAKQEQK